MTIKRLPRPRDPLALAKLIGDIATGLVADTLTPRFPPALAHPEPATRRN